ncbi:barbed-end actin filament uncapping [Tritrichomonas musculus]|uniref:Barbed-end actin filament uncapping n=1 Tax=Tritrichomonas musculus TaxID=1915356 RepID=A0ABR2L6H9_9EUKA
MDQNLVATIKNTIAQSGYTNLYIAQIKKSDIVAINNRCLMTFNQKGNKPTNTFSWLTLTAIKYARPKLKFIFHKNKYSIIISDENIVKSVSEALQRILLSRELRSIGWSNLNLPSLPSSPYSALNRIMEKAHLQKIKIGQDSYEKIFSILIYSLPEFYLNDIPNINSFMDIFLESLPLFSDVYNFVVGKMNKFDPYSVLTDSVPYLKELKRFEIIGPKTEAFSDFFKAFSKHQHIHLYSVSFRNSDLDEKDLSVVHDFLIGRNIKGVEFHKAIKKEVISPFFQFFFEKDLLNNLRSLNISESNEIDINRLIPKLSNIQVLSLAKCDVEVGDTLRKLSSLTNLKMLDLSNNPCRIKISSMPPNLTSLYLNFVTWSDQTLFYLISNLPKHYFNLYMCNTLASPIEWRAFYSYLPTIKGPFGLESLGFDGNSIHPNFFNFLSENNRLSYLSINGCLAESDSTNVAALCKYIASSKTLEELIIKGSKTIYLGRALDAVITSCIQSKNIHTLDISDNRGGDSSINIMRQFVTTKNSLETLVFDGMGVNTTSLYVDFLRNAINSKKLNLSFPFFDLMNLVKKEAISKQDFLQIKDLFASCSEGGRIFKKYPNYNAFPSYLRRDRFSELSDPIEPITIKPPPKPPQNPKPKQNPKKPNQKPQNKPNPNQNQNKQQDQQAQLQIQQLQQQLQQQQFQIQQQQQQIQQQIIQQQQLQQIQQSPRNPLIGNGNINRKSSNPKLNNTRNEFSPNNRNIEPTLIADYDDYDPYRYNTYDSYHSDTNRKFDDYYDYDNFDYSPIENIKKSKLPPRPNSASRYRNEQQNFGNSQRNIQNNNRGRQSANSNRTNSSRGLNNGRQRRSQSVRRNSDITNSPKANRNSTRNVNNNRPNNTRNTSKSMRPQRSASACQMRRTTTNNNRNNHFDDSLDSYVTNENNNDYYSDEVEFNNSNRDRNNKIRNRNRNMVVNDSYDYDYEDNDNFNYVKNNKKTGSKRNKITRSNSLNSNNLIDTFNNSNRNTKTKKIKNNIFGDYDDNDNTSNDDDNDSELLMNKPKPALRTKPKNKNKKEQSTKKSPHKAEVKPAVKELQKQNKMKLRQAQLKQQIKQLEEEDIIDDTTNESNTDMNTLMTTKEVVFNDDESNLETTYDIPTWNFPIKLKFEFDDERTFKIEKRYSTANILEEILKKQTSKKASTTK